MMGSTQAIGVGRSVFGGEGMCGSGASSFQTSAPVGMGANIQGGNAGNQAARKLLPTEHLPCDGTQKREALMRQAFTNGMRLFMPTMANS